MWFGLSTIAFLALLAIIVALTLLVENWGRWRQPVATVSSPAGPRPEHQLVIEDLGEAVEGDRAQPDLEVLADALDLQATSLPASGTDGADELFEPSSPLEVRLDGQSAADRLVAVLFAAYAAGRLPEANRAAAWVTASERPPSDDGSICDPGTSLRGRPAAVQRLLECDEGGRTWVTLNENVDIGLGVSRRPPTCEVLGALVALWHATRQDRTQMSGEAVAELAEALDALRPTWSSTSAAAADVVEPVAAVLAAAASRTPAGTVTLTLSDRAAADRPAAHGPDVVVPPGEQSSRTTSDTREVIAALA